MAGVNSPETLKPSVICLSSCSNRTWEDQAVLPLTGCCPGAGGRQDPGSLMHMFNSCFCLF